MKQLSLVAFYGEKTGSLASLLDRIRSAAHGGRGGGRSRVSRVITIAGASGGVGAVAIDLLTAVAYEYPNTEQGDAAVHMVLDSYRTINDISNLIDTGRRVIGDPSGADHDLAEVQESAQRIREDLGFMEVPFRLVFKSRSKGGGKRVRTS